MFLSQKERLASTSRKLLGIPICDVVAYGERRSSGWRGRVENMDAAVGGFDAEIVTCVALLIEEHRADAGSAGTEIVHSERGNEMLKGFQEQTF